MVQLIPGCCGHHCLFADLQQCLNVDCSTAGELQLESQASAHVACAVLTEYTAAFLPAAHTVWSRSKGNHFRLEGQQMLASAVARQHGRWLIPVTYQLGLNSDVIADLQLHTCMSVGPN